MDCGTRANNERCRPELLEVLNQRRKTIEGVSGVVCESKRAEFIDAVAMSPNPLPLHFRAEQRRHTVAGSVVRANSQFCRSELLDKLHEQRYYIGDESSDEQSGHSDEDKIEDLIKTPLRPLVSVAQRCRHFEDGGSASSETPSYMSDGTPSPAFLRVPKLRMPVAPSSENWIPPDNFEPLVKVKRFSISTQRGNTPTKVSPDLLHDDGGSSTGSTFSNMYTMMSVGYKGCLGERPSAGEGPCCRLESSLDELVFDTRPEQRSRDACGCGVQGLCPDDDADEAVAVEWNSATVRAM